MICKYFIIRFYDYLFKMKVVLREDEKSPQKTVTFSQHNR